MRDTFAVATLEGGEEVEDGGDSRASTPTEGVAASEAKA